MYYLAFAVFFAINFSLWFIVPALALKNIIKPGRKKKDDNLKMYLIVYGFISVIYVLIYLLFFYYFNTAINDIGIVDPGQKTFFTTEISNISVMLVLFFIISIVQGIYTYFLARKLFIIREVDKGYIVCCFTGFLNILTYWFSNSVLKLAIYSFDEAHNIFNLMMKVDCEILLFLFPVLVFTNFALSFMEK